MCDSISLDVVIDSELNKRLEITPLRVNAGIPSETTNTLYTKRIFASLTKNLEHGEYSYDGNKLVINIH